MENMVHEVFGRLACTGASSTGGTSALQPLFEMHVTGLVPVPANAARSACVCSAVFSFPSSLSFAPLLLCSFAFLISFLRLSECIDC